MARSSAHALLTVCQKRSGEGVEATVRRRRQQPSVSALKHLVLFKQAMISVSSHISWDPSGYEAVTAVGDKVGIGMKYLRAVERGAMGEISKCLLLYPGISDYVANPYDTSGTLYTRLRPLRDHVVELARQQALEGFGEADELDAAGEADRARRVRQRASRLLFKLAPGKAGVIGAIRCGSGALATDPASSAKVLRQCWEQVFRARGVDDDKLWEWIQDDLQERRDTNQGHEVMQTLTLQREHIEAALSRSNNSPPGPDGVPYSAWRRLGTEAVDILFAAALELTSEAGLPMLGRVYAD